MPRLDSIGGGEECKVQSVPVIKVLDIILRSEGSLPVVKCLRCSNEAIFSNYGEQCYFNTAFVDMLGGHSSDQICVASPQRPSPKIQKGDASPSSIYHRCRDGDAITKSRSRSKQKETFLS